MTAPTYGEPVVQPDDIVARIDALIPANEVHTHPLVWRARNIDLALLIDARNEIRALRARVEVLKCDRRERIATACLAGLLSDPTNEDGADSMTGTALRFADALIAKLEAKP